MNSRVKILCSLAMLLLFTSSIPSSGAETPKTGKVIFENKCSRCHGADGAKGKWGAKNLQKSTLSDAEIISIISQGRRIMPSWERILTEPKIKEVKDYIKTLRSIQ